LHPTEDQPQTTEDQPQTTVLSTFTLPDKTPTVEPVPPTGAISKRYQEGSTPPQQGRAKVVGTCIHYFIMTLQVILKDTDSGRKRLSKSGWRTTILLLHWCQCGRAAKPEFDWAKTDSRNLIGVISSVVEPGLGGVQIRMKYGGLEGTYYPNQYMVLETNHLHKMIYGVYIDTFFIHICAKMGYFEAFGRYFGWLWNTKNQFAIVFVFFQVYGIQ
jgi:hypothetical protein